MDAFAGWPPEAFDFFAGLEVDNSKGYWHANRDVYERAVRQPMETFAAVVAEGYGPLHIFRPYRDVRFRHDKSPYKTQCGAVTEGDGGEAYYLHVSADGLFAASGYYQMARDQLERYYAAVDHVDTGRELAGLLTALPEELDVGGSVLRTAPRGYPRDHPRVELRRHKSVMITRSFPPAPWQSTPEAAERVTAVWDAARPVNAWLNRHVGPTTMPRQRR